MAPTFFLVYGTSAARSSGFAGWKSSDPIAASFAAIIPRSEAKRNGMSMFFEFKGKSERELAGL